MINKNNNFVNKLKCLLTKVLINQSTNHTKIKNKNKKRII